MDKELTFTGQEAVTAQVALRNALGLPRENFSVQAFVGMISDEIEELRSKGHTDERIAKLVSDATGKEIDSQSLNPVYASPEERGHHHES